VVAINDIIGDPASCVFDSELSQAFGSLVKIFGRYESEWVTPADSSTWRASSAGRAIQNITGQTDTD